MKKNTHIKEAYNYLKYRKIVANMQDLADKVVAQRTSVSAALNGNPEYLTPSFCKRFNQAFDEMFNENWLLTGEGSMLKETTQADNNATFIAPYITDELVYLPLITTSAVASFIENLQDATEEMDTYPVYVAKGETFDINKHVVIDVSGDSMYPTINDKAKVLCERIKPEQWENIPNEKVVAVVYGNSFTIKRLLKNNLVINNSITLLADNRKYGETILQRCEIRAIFRVIKKVSEEVF